MSTTPSRAQLAAEYEASAQAYLRRLPPEHFMEATAQAKQREITVESLALVHAQRPDVQYFNELLVQYPRRGRRKKRQVVPDNMVVVCPQPLTATGSYDLPLQPEPPFWVLEYVSKNSRRKDYEDNFDRYEQELKVPYYLLFYPETQDLTLYHHSGTKYVAVPADAEGRHPLPEVELEVGLVDGWVRYWFRGQLLSLPAELQRELDEARQRADQEKHRADEEKLRADQEKHRADQEKHRADQERQQWEQERQGRLAAEQELERLRALLRQAPLPPEAP